MNSLNNYHLFKVTAIPQTNFEPTRLKIYSERFGQEVIISVTERDAVDTAVKYLTQNNFSLIGEAEGQLIEDQDGNSIREMFIISETFKPLTQ